MKLIDTIYQYQLFVPYRICPLGAHIDHQLGIVTGFAIDIGIRMDYSKTVDGTFNIKSHDFTNELSFNYNSLPKKNGSWQDYLVGSILALQENYELKKGLNAYIYKALPIGGLASSSAIIIAYILALVKANNISINSTELIQLVLKVENKYLNHKVGLLDPSCEIYCKKDSLLYLDTKTNAYKLIKSNKKLDFKICLIYSGVSRKLTNTLYNVRVDECKVTAFLMNSIMRNKPIEFEDSYLRNFSFRDFEYVSHQLPVNQRKRAIHFYSEMDRVKKGVKYFKDGDLIKFGQLIFDSGTSSIENYEVGIEQLAVLHEILKKTDGVYGGRCSGAGFHGYYIAIVNPEKEEEIRNFVTKEYLNLYPQYRDDFKIYFCRVGDGIEL